MAAPADVYFSEPNKLAQLAWDCYDDFETFCMFVYQQLPAPHHRVIIDRLLYGQQRELILGPPGTGKSTYIIRYLAWVIGRNPNYRWLCASEVANGIATTNVATVAGTIELDERYHFVFGHLKDPTGRTPWSTQNFTVRPLVTRAQATARNTQTPPPPWPWLSPRGRNQRITGKHPTAKAVGWRTGFAGARCDGIFADDLVSDRLSRSEKMTIQVHETLEQKLIARLDGYSPEQRVLIAGQHYAANDLYVKLRTFGRTVFDNNPLCEGLHVLEEVA
jgi:hypothetical protein